MVSVQFQSSIKSVQTDWGGEFSPCSKHLADLGILHRTICPHTHHQSGSVESKHKHIVEMGLSLLAQAYLLIKFWDHAFITTVYLINRLPTAVLDYKVPFTVLYNALPNYKFLKVFGCACYPCLRPYNANKLQFRSADCTFLDYSTSHKGYECLSPQGRLYISKDVLFNEFRFSYAEASTAPVSSQ